MVRILVDTPIAGQAFRFGVEHGPDAGSAGGISVQVVTGQGQPIASFDCPDPPCHDMVVHIAHDLAGERLTLHARSASGATAVEEVTVGRPRPAPLAR